MENSLIKDWIVLIFWLIVASPLIGIVVFITILAALIDKLKWK